MKSPLEQFDILNVKNFFSSVNDYSFNSILVPFVIIIFLFFVFLFFILLKNAKTIPLVLQSVVEMDYRFLINIIKQQAGIKGLL